MRITVPLVGMVAAGTGIGAFNWPLVCLSSPPVQLIAGTTNVSAINENPYSRNCRAILDFADPAFKPITYSFTPTAPCPGPRVTSFQIPPGAPDGDARIIWQCKFASTCNLAVISNSTGDPPLVSHQNGTVECLPLTFGTKTSVPSAGWTELPSSLESQSASTTMQVPTPIATLNPSGGWNFTNIGNKSTPAETAEFSSATRTSVPPWTIMTITHTITTLLTTAVLV